MNQLSITTKLYILLAVITLPVFGYYVWNVFGSTTTNVTLGREGTLNNGLVAHWTFDGPDVDIGSNLIIDSSGQGNNGTTIGMDTASTTVRGAIGQALFFDGVDDSVDTGPSSVTGEITVALWVNFATTGTDHKKLASGGFKNGVTAWEFKQGLQGGGDPSDDLRFQSFSGGVAHGASVPMSLFTAGTWHHLAGMYTGSTWKIYVDGVDQTDTTYNVGTGAQSADTIRFIGAIDGGDGTPNDFFDGALDDVRLYNRPLSADEVKQLYELGATTKIGKTLNTEQTEGGTGLVGHWTFDGPDMTDNVADISDNGNHGALTGQTSTTTINGRIGQALEFDGADDVVDFGSDPSLDVIGNGPVTFTVWIRPESHTDTAGRIISKETNGGGTGWGPLLQWVDTYAIHFLADYATLNLRRTTANNFLTPGEWQFIAATWDGSDSASNIHIYKNGVESSSYQFTQDGTGGKVTDNTHNLALGSRAGGGGEFYGGGMDDVRVYDRVLSEDEIKHIYELGATTKIGKTLNTEQTGSTGLVAHWTFDGPNMINNVSDISGQGNHGFFAELMAQIPTTTARGRIGQGLQFGGQTDEHTSVPHDPSIDFGTGKDMTLAVWIKTDIGCESNNCKIFIKRAGGDTQWYTIQLDATDRDFCFEYNGGASLCDPNNQDLTDGEWHHLSATVDRSETLLTIYLDSEQVNSLSSFTADMSNTSNFSLGGGASAVQTTEFFNGILDDARIYDRALSADEIRRLYDLGR